MTSESPTSNASAKSRVGVRCGNDRFTDLESVTEGGSAHLYHAHDAQLGVPAALKAIHPNIPGALERLGELPVEVAVKHRGVVSLLGRWRADDGRIWLAMPWIDGGGTLLHVVCALHGSNRWSDPTVKRTGGPRPRQPRRVQPDIGWVNGAAALMLLAEAAFAIGAAHAAGYVHLDLKPDNIMFEMEPAGADGVMRRTWRFWHEPPPGADPCPPPELMPRARVIDWGLSLAVGSTESWSGDVPGVPCYMAPERVRGGPGATAATADVYALGAILFELLTGAPPHGMDRDRVRRVLSAVPPPEPPAIHPHPIQVGADMAPFVEVCRRALDPDPARRPQDATAFALALSRARSQVLRDLTRRLRDESERDRRRARALLADADARLRALDDTDYENLEARHAPWSDIQRAREDLVLADIREAQAIHQLRAILAVDRNFAEVRADLIEWRSDRILSLQRQGDHQGARIALEELKVEVRGLRESCRPDAVPETLRRADALLRGQGRFSLELPAGCRIALARQRLVNRRLCIDGFEPLDADPRHGVLLKAGHWLARLDQPGHHPTLYPVRIYAGESWPPDGVETAPGPVLLPESGALGDDDAYVPAGPAWLGGLEGAPDSPMPGRWVWVGGLVMKRHPVTHGDWCHFLDDLLVTGRVSDAERFTPKARPDGPPGHPHCVIVGGSHRLYFGGEHAPAMRELPVTLVSWHAAMAYADWFDARCRARALPSGWRLPSEWEFEKVARVGDERLVHWGHTPEPRFTRVAGSTLEMYQPTSVRAMTCDVTPHGIRWIAGNAQTWCLEPWMFDGPWGHLDVNAAIEGARTGDHPERMVRGAAYNTTVAYVSGGTRFALPPDTRLMGVGLRLVRSWPPRPVSI